MATYSRLCSDEELQKARDDLRDIIARRRGVAGGGSMDAGHIEEGGGADKKTRTRVLPQEEVDKILSICSEELPGHENIDRMAKASGEVMYMDCKTLVTVAGILTKNLYDIIRAAQDDLRHEIETNGYYAYEVTDDEAENGSESVRSTGPRGKGRRRHRPGIVKHAGAVKKLN